MAKKIHKLKSKSIAGKKEQKVMHEFKYGELHSGSKKGPIVKNRKQAIAIALSEARKAGGKVKPLAKNKPLKKRGKIAKKARMALKRRK